MWWRILNQGHTKQSHSLSKEVEEGYHGLQRTKPHTKVWGSSLIENEEKKKVDKKIEQWKDEQHLDDLFERRRMEAP